MENINNFENIHSFQNNLLFKKKESKEEEFKNINAEHFLSLRKKRNNRYTNQLKHLNLAQKQISHDLNLNEIINYIKNEEIFLLYKKTGNESDKLNYIIQMIYSLNNNLLKFGLFELKKYLTSIVDKNEFATKNLLIYLNEKVFRSLFILLFKKKIGFLNLEEYYQITILLCHIISNLCELNDSYINILLEYYPNLLEMSDNEEDYQLKKSIYTLNYKIFLIKNINENKFEKLPIIKQIYFEKVCDEIINLNKDFSINQNIITLKIIFPTLINIVSSIIYNDKQVIINNSNINIKKILLILSFANKYINSSFSETDILISMLKFINIFLNFYKISDNSLDKDSDYKFREVINNIEFGKHIISFIYDNSINDFEFRYEIIELMNNMIPMNNTDFINNLIENGISEQIENIQEYLLENDNNCNIDEKNMKLLYNSHLELIYNLISTQSVTAINDICIENRCISNLFQLYNNSRFGFDNNKSKILLIFDLIIRSKAEFVISLLLSEDIYDFYKNILFNSNNHELLVLILNDIAIMIQRGKNIKISSGINFVSNHFIKNGIFDLIDNIKGRADFNEQINYLLDEISNLLN